MARWFDFSNDEYEFKSLGSLCRLWEKVPDRQAVNSIAEAHQYFDFIRIMIIERLQSWSHPIGDRESWFTPTPLVLSGRAGAISSCIVAGTSIIECAMRAHAENRKLKKLIKKDPKHRTFGAVIHAWESHGVYSIEIDPVLDDLKLLLGKRNNIHLYASFGRRWEDIVREEMDLLSCIDRLFVFFQNLDPAT